MHYAGGVRSKVPSTGATKACSAVAFGDTQRLIGGCILAVAEVSLTWVVVGYPAIRMGRV